jgi:hypothetical protein
MTSEPTSVVDLAPLKSSLSADILADRTRDTAAGVLLALARQVDPELVARLEKDAAEKTKAAATAEEGAAEEEKVAQVVPDALPADPSAALARISSSDFALLSSISLSLGILEGLRERGTSDGWIRA